MGINDILTINLNNNVMVKEYIDNVNAIPDINIENISINLENFKLIIDGKTYDGIYNESENNMKYDIEFNDNNEESINNTSKNTSSINSINLLIEEEINEIENNSFITKKTKNIIITDS